MFRFTDSETGDWLEWHDGAVTGSAVALAAFREWTDAVPFPRPPGMPRPQQGPPADPLGSAMLMRASLGPSVTVAGEPPDFPSGHQSPGSTD